MGLFEWVLVACLSAPAAVPGAALEEAREAYLRGDFERASEAFARAYAEDPRPEFVYAQAQSERHAGRCDRAVHSYVRFLELSPEGPDAVKASQNLLHCQTELLRPRAEPTTPPAEPVQPEVIEPAPAPAPAPVVERSVATIEPPPRERTRKGAPAWLRDPFGGVFVGLGLAGAATGGALLGVAHRDRDRAGSAANLGEYRERVERDMVLERAGLVVLPIGSALIVGGVIRWIVVARRERVRSRATASDRRASAPIPRGLR